MEHRHRGIIKVWRDEKGFGFIAPTTGDPDLFFHIRSVTNSRSRDLLGQHVTYEVRPGRDGKPSAVDVRLTLAGDGVRPKHYRSRRGVIFAWIFSLSFIAAVAFVSVQYLSPFVPVAYAYLSRYVPVAYVAISVFTYITYRNDKKCALEGYWRVPESTLHLMEFLGGWPGALVAQWSLPHKNRKASYQVGFWIIVILHVAALAFFANTYLIDKQSPSRPPSPSSQIHFSFV